jgi:drug/metabolite transporter (DMT)-like permease
VALVPLVLLALALEPHPVIRWEPTTILVLLYSGPLATAFAYWATQSITRSLGALASATGFLGAPVVGLGSSALLLGEPISIVDIAAFGLVLLGIAIVSMTRPVPGAPPA